MASLRKREKVMGCVGYQNMFFCKLVIHKISSKTGFAKRQQKTRFLNPRVLYLLSKQPLSVILI